MAHARHPKSMGARKPAYKRALRQKENRTSGLPTVMCRVCNQYFRQLGSHVVQRHFNEDGTPMTARDYKIRFGIPTTHSLMAADLIEERRQMALDNGMPDHLVKVGINTRFKKGDKSLGKYERTEETLEMLKERAKSMPSFKTVDKS